jgi:hypothetical protein
LSDGEALKDVASEAGGIGGPRRLCRLAQKLARKKTETSAAGRDGACRNCGLFSAVIEDAAERLHPRHRASVLRRGGGWSLVSSAEVAETPALFPIELNICTPPSQTVAASRESAAVVSLPEPETLQVYKSRRPLANSWRRRRRALGSC